MAHVSLVSDVKKITCLTIQLTVGFLSPDNGGTEGGVKTIEYFMYVRPWFRVPVYVCPSMVQSTRLCMSVS